MLALVYACLTVLSFALLGHAASSPPAGAITVGNGGKYSTLSAALKDTSSSTYFVYSGSYKDTVVITRANIQIYGQTNTAGSYTGNTVTITNNIPASSAGSNDKSGTVQVHADGVSLYNLNIANTYGKPADQSQAIALSLQGTNFGGYGLKIAGYQDTLLANTGKSFISQSFIEGAVDFIFGQRGSLWITKSVINCIGTGYITASGRESNDANYYVIDSSTVQGSGKVYLGRPWRNYARVIFQKTSLGSNVQSVGWSVWSSSDTRTDHVTFAEYSNTGSGAGGSRASFSSKLSSAVSIATALGSTSWIDSAFL